MSEGVDPEFRGGRGLSVAAAGKPQGPREVCFDRREMNAILEVYGRKVAAGEWCDYAIDQHRDEAVFSIFRRASEYPLYRVVKTPALAKRRGAYAVHAAGGLILKVGPNLRTVLFALETTVRLVKA